MKSKETLEEKIGKKDLAEKVKKGVRNWAIDTSAKIGVYAPLLGTMEAYNGLSAEQIIGARATSALVDTFIARAYTKTADFLGEKTEPLTYKIGRKGVGAINELRRAIGKDKLDFSQKKKVYRAVDEVRNYVTDTASMIGTYAPVYAGILYANGANHKQVATASLMAAGIAAVTSRPFRKFVLSPWRKLCGFRR